MNKQEGFQMEIRKEIMDFAVVLERVMRTHDDEKYDSYKTLPHGFLVNKFYEEKSEMEESKFLDRKEIVDTSLTCFMLWYYLESRELKI